MAKNAVQILGSFLVKRYNLTPEEATSFVTAAFDVIRVGLERDKQVKVKGLGTFKVSTVKARESVNVNTGERVVIDEHEKVTFTPDNTMKELVNRPFSQFETVIVNDGVSFDAIDDSAEEETQSSEVDEENQNELSAEVSNKEIVTEGNETPVTQAVSAQEKEQDEKATADQSVSNIGESIEVAASSRPLNAKERFAKLMDESEPISQAEPKEQPSQKQTDVTEETEEKVAEQSTPFNQASQEVEPKVKEVAAEHSEPAEPEIDHNEKIEQLEAKLQRSKCRTVCCIVVSIVAVVLCSIIGFLYGKNYLNETAQPSKTVATQAKDTSNNQTIKRAPATVATTANANPIDTTVQAPSSTPSLETIDLEAANQYRSIRYGAYKIVGVEKVVLKPKETMQSFCHRHLGRDMMGYLEAVNSDMNKQGGDTIILPKLELK